MGSVSYEQFHDTPVFNQLQAEKRTEKEIAALREKLVGEVKR